MEFTNKPTQPSIATNVSISKRIGCTLFCLVAFIFLRIPNEIAPQFAETFDAFGAELPLFTLMMLALAPVYTLISYLTGLPLLIWLVFLFSPAQQRLLFKSGLIIFLIAFVLVIVFIAAMYLPIFNLGAVV
jgi:type II secretory pathway component PulF